MTQGPDSSVITWSVPQCPFTVECPLRILDEIRLAVIDAFFSLPRGGAEIGGVLTGRYSGSRLRIMGYKPLECEHAFGPSFTLSERDHTRLRELLSEIEAENPGPQAVGWYHSHTRTEIFLSEPDREVHDHFFPQSWQVALVLKPHTFQPTRAGFFFREEDGRIHGEQSYQEFLIQPQPIQPQAPSRSEAPPVRVEPPPKAPPPRETPPPAVTAIAPLVATPASPPVPLSMADVAEVAYEPQTPAIALDTVPEVPVEEAVPEPLAEAAAAAPARQPEPPPLEAPPLPPPPPLDEIPLADPTLPRFLAAETPEPKPSRVWLWWVIAAVAVLGGGYITRNLWWDETVGAIQTYLKGPQVPALGLRTRDANGQLEIQWDPHSPALKTPKGARLTIVDGPKVRGIPLDLGHLASGAFTYGRESGRVEVSLAITQPNGQVIREQTTYLGTPIVSADTSTAGVQDELRDENAKLKSDLAKEHDRAIKQEKQIRYLQNQLERELRLRRLEKQMDPLVK